MDGKGGGWYFSCMDLPSAIPAFNLFGETGAFPDVIHCERIWDRARLHDWAITPHRHRDMAQLFVLKRGRAQVWLDERELDLDDGGLLFVPARSVHGFRFRQGTEGLVLSFPLPVLAGGIADRAGAVPDLSRPVTGLADARVTVLCGEIQSAFAATGPYRASLLVALSHALLAAVAIIAARSDESGHPPQHRRMTEFDRLIARHMAEGWGAADYAAALAVTPGHLNRICRSALGIGATAHIETVTMTEARRLLAFTRLSVAEVGYRLGFGDPSYFSRRFRVATGESPSAYRGRFGAGQGVEG